MDNTPKGPLLLWSSVLAGLQVLTGGAALADMIGATVAGFLVLAVAAFQVGTQFYINGQVTPNTQVAAQVVGGEVVAGPAADSLTGTPVEVVESADPPLF